ncbi:DNA polymerase domain-containing protein [Janthinobacterium sp.]|uniref:DNA polymerase domain-containing protein n=1 Tax=Janthinobacterium sp. TaxID=1871054 RepID=UPI0026248BE9|nr:DNA polymerase domain-containing protein [Janthinobacterium sp.]
MFNEMSDEELLAAYEDLDRETKELSFVVFAAYNCRDVELLRDLEKLHTFLKIVNQMTHENTCNFKDMLGTVRYVESGITNYARHNKGLVVPDKNPNIGNIKKVEGAIVLTPRMGLHDWMGSVDLTSLYPSIIRALKMSLETYVGKFGDGSDPAVGERAWYAVWKKHDTEHSAWIEGDEYTMTGAEWHDFIREQDWCISATGILFDNKKEGILASILTDWFAERKRLQGEMRRYAKLADEATKKYRKAYDADVFRAGGMVKEDIFMYTQAEWDEIDELTKQAELYDLLQYTKKIQLNSTYGYTLSPHGLWGNLNPQRVGSNDGTALIIGGEIGSSVTGSGRQITKFMSETIATALTGEKAELLKYYAFDKITGKKVKADDISIAYRDGDKAFFDRLRTTPMPAAESEYDDDDEEFEEEYKKEKANGAVWITWAKSCIAGDTDSNYFATGADNYDDAVAIADGIAELVNDEFPNFMREAFNCTGGREFLMKAAREVVAEKGLFLAAKKKYQLRVVNMEGKDLREKPKMKSMGSETKKSDTPKVVQDFLKEMLDMILQGAEYPEVETFVNTSRSTVIRGVKNLFKIGTAKQINKLESYTAEWERLEKPGLGKAKLPGNVRAAVNYNAVVRELDTGDKILKSGDKGVIFYLLPNEWGFKTIALPSDFANFPVWFDENFQVDRKLTETKMIDTKLERTFEALNWEIPTPQKTFVKSFLKF